METHWVNNKQATIFAGVLYFINSDNKLNQKKIVLLSVTLSTMAGLSPGEMPPWCKIIKAAPQHKTDVLLCHT